MSAQAKALRRPRALTPVHARIEAQSAEMWARFHATQRMAQAEDFPDLVALYYFAVKQWNDSVRYSPFFTYLGRRYRWEVTNIGRMRVLHPKTRAVLILGGPGAIW
jgi:hypothetical protein